MASEGRGPLPVAVSPEALAAAVAAFGRRGRLETRLHRALAAAMAAAPEPVGHGLAEEGRATVDVAEGRRLLDRAHDGDVNAVAPLEHFLYGNARALLQAAEAMDHLRKSFDTRGLLLPRDPFPLWMQCVVSTDHIILERDALKADVKAAIEDRGFVSLFDLIDNAEVGRSFMDEIDCLRKSGDPFVSTWTPLDGPAEILTALVNAKDDEIAAVQSSLDLALAEVERLREESERLKKLHVSFDGPYSPNDQRQWLARQLLDSKLDDAEAFGIVAHHPNIKDARKEPDHAR